MPPEEAAEVRKAAMKAIAGNVRVMLCMRIRGHDGGLRRILGAAPGCL